MTPQRIRLSRRAGYRKPAGAVVVSRPSRWGNMFQVEKLPTPLFPPGSWGLRDLNYKVAIPDDLRVYDARYLAVVVAVRFYELHTGPMGAYEYDLDQLRHDLGGRDLACWCPLVDEHGDPMPCHADSLLARANEAAP